MVRWSGAGNCYNPQPNKRQNPPSVPVQAGVEESDKHVAVLGEMVQSIGITKTEHNRCRTSK